jgi:urea carboxylase-associated protein 1
MGEIKFILDEIVPARQPWGARIAANDVLTIIDLEGQQAVDFLCYDGANPQDRYSATNTVKVQGNIFVGLGSVLYSDSGAALMTVIEDTVGRHDTVYGCCSNPNNFLRYGVHTTESCYSNFESILKRYDLDRSAIVPNVNWFMSVPVLDDGSAGVAAAALKPGSHVALRAERDVLAVLSNCPQMHNPCNGYNPTPIRVTVTRASRPKKN